MSEVNPYAPPQADTGFAADRGEGDEGRPGYKLYTPGHVTLATFLGTPLAGMFLLSQNRKRLGMEQLARTTMIYGVVATALLFILGFALPESVGRFVSIAATIAVAQYAKQDQPLLDAHRRRGGAKESGWKAAGIGVLGMVAALSLVFGAVLLIGVE